MDGLDNLLDDAMNRAKLKKYFIAFKVIEATDMFILQILPQSRRDDAKGISLKDGVLLIGCKNSSVKHLIQSKENELLDYLKKEIPSISILRVQTRLVATFHDIM